LATSTSTTRVLGMRVEQWFKANLGECIPGHRNVPDWVASNGGADVHAKIDGYMEGVSPGYSFNGTFQVKADCRGLNLFQNDFGTPRLFVDRAATYGGAEWFVVLAPGIGVVTWAARHELARWYWQHERHERGGRANKGIPWPFADYANLPFMNYRVSSPLFRYFKGLWHSEVGVWRPK